MAFKLACIESARPRQTKTGGHLVFLRYFRLRRYWTRHVIFALSIKVRQNRLDNWSSYNDFVVNKMAAAAISYFPIFHHEQIQYD